MVSQLARKRRFDTITREPVCGILEELLAKTDKNARVQSSQPDVLMKLRRQERSTPEIDLRSSRKGTPRQASLLFIKSGHEHRKRSTVSLSEGLLKLRHCTLEGRPSFLAWSPMHQ